jgi:hypothetical protein
MLLRKRRRTSRDAAADDRQLERWSSEQRVEVLKGFAVALMRDRSAIEGRYIYGVLDRRRQQALLRANTKRTRRLHERADQLRLYATHPRWLSASLQEWLASGR